MHFTSHPFLIVLGVWHTSAFSSQGWVQELFDGHLECMQQTDWYTSYTGMKWTKACQCLPWSHMLYHCLGLQEQYSNM